MRRISVVLGVSALAVAIAAPARVLAISPNAGPPTCRVEDLATGSDYTNKDVATPVQEAIDAAAPGATIQIMGICVGTSTINKDLTLQGKATPKDPTPTLDGNGAGSVVTVDTASVSIAHLVIRNGSARSGGGILEDEGSVTLIDSTVTGNTAKYGGGISISLGTGTILDSTVTGNSATVLGGGITNDFSGGIFVTNSTVSGNSALLGGGIANGGAAFITDSTVNGNTATAGGGIYNVGATSLGGATDIRLNTADAIGGGIWEGFGGTTDVTSNWTGVVSDNTPDNCEPSLLLSSTVCS